MNYGKLTAGTTKTAIDTAKPSEKGEIITYLSRMGDVLGEVIEGTGGARKMRIALGGRGKSGGARVIYVDVLEREHLYLLFAYPKNVQENLTAEQKKMLRKITEEIRKE